MSWTTLPRSELAPGIAGWQGGEGPHLLLIHGVGLRAEAWSAMVPELCEHFTVSAIDMPGHGGSKILEKPDPGLADYSGAIGSVLDNLSGEVRVAGHSMGALIAVDLAIRYSERIVAVAGLNMIFRRSPEAARAVRARADALEPGRIADPSKTLERWFGKAPKDQMAEAAAACRDWLVSMDPAAFRSAYRVFAGEDGPSDEQLRQMPAQALFMTGSDEPNSTPQMSKALADMASNGQYSIMDGAAHMMTMTHGREVAAKLVGFMA